MNKDLRLALKAGLTSYLLSSIVVAILLSPYWAGLHDYGHSHNNDSKHIHLLNFFIQVDLAIPKFTVHNSAKIIEFLFLISILALTSSFQRHLRSRSPPLFVGVL